MKIKIMLLLLLIPQLLFGLTELVEELTIELENSNELIITLKEEVKNNQKEISYFREKVEQQIIKPKSKIKIGLGIGYPSQAEIITSYNIFSIFNVYGRLSIGETLSASTGILINF